MSYLFQELLFFLSSQPHKLAVWLDQLKAKCVLWQQSENLTYGKLAWKFKNKNIANNN